MIVSSQWAQLAASSLAHCCLIPNRKTLHPELSPSTHAEGARHPRALPQEPGDCVQVNTHLLHGVSLPQVLGRARSVQQLRRGCEKSGGSRMVGLLDQVSHASGASSGSVSEGTPGYSHTHTDSVLKQPNPQLHQGCLLLPSPPTGFLGDTEGHFVFHVASWVGIRRPRVAGHWQQIGHEAPARASSKPSTARLQQSRFSSLQMYLREEAAHLIFFFFFLAPY